jgi:DNA-binding NtrC family response regulator
MPPFHCLIVSGSRERRRVLEETLRAGGQVIVPAEEPREIAEALAVPGPEWLAMDLTIPGLDVPALQGTIDPAGPNPPDSLESAERRHIARTLEFTRGNRRQAARLLGIARSTMLAKLRKSGLEDVRGPDDGSS